MQRILYDGSCCLIALPGTNYYLDSSISEENSLTTGSYLVDISSLIRYWRLVMT
jgi:hypothetical protein